MLIDFETDLDANNSRGIGSIREGDMVRVSTPQNGGDLSIFAPGSAGERQSVFESVEGPNMSGANDPTVAAPERPQFLEDTDLDILLSRTEGENLNGDNYDVRTVCAVDSMPF